MYAIIRGNVHYQAATKIELVQCVYTIEIKTLKNYTKEVYINGKLDTITYSYEWSQSEVMTETIKRCIRLLQNDGWILYKSID